jgi:undecaprenyl-diphosphatase
MLPIDPTLFTWFNATASSPQWMLKLALFASQELPGLMVAGTVGAFIVGGRDVRQGVLRVLLAMAMAWTLARMGQHLFSLPRPFALGLGTQWAPHGNSAGFPSTHASVAFAFAGAVAIHTRYRLLAMLAILMAAMIAWSRMCLGLHFPSDVMAGMSVGLLCAQISVRLVRPRLLAQVAH